MEETCRKVENLEKGPALSVRFLCLQRVCDLWLRY
jgi:hypothetical protein